MRFSRLTVLTLLFVCLSSAAHSIPIGQPAPDFSFSKTWNAPGGKTKLSDYRGSVVLLECWATWCGPCKQVIPHMRQIRDSYGPKGLQIISVSDEGAGTIEPFIKNNNMDYPVAQARGVLGKYGRRTIPSAWLIDASGIVVWEGHPGQLTGQSIDAALSGAAVTSSPGSASQGAESNWWVWAIVLPGLLFAGAMGWFVWSTRDKTPKHVQMMWQQPPGPPQPQGPAPGQPPGPYGAPPPQQPNMPPPAGGQQGYLNAPNAPQTLGYNAPPPVQQYGQQPDVGGGNAYGAGTAFGSGTEFHEPKKDAPFLGGNPEPEGEQFPPFDTNQNRPGNPYR
ncbi:MAG: TlpA disulfide reductase family protein [Planctomycetota bacterium]